LYENVNKFLICKPKIGRPRVDRCIACGNEGDGRSADKIRHLRDRKQNIFSNSRICIKIQTIPEAGYGREISGREGMAVLAGFWKTIDIGHPCASGEIGLAPFTPQTRKP
jgi:hypothetical protein